MDRNIIRTSLAMVEAISRKNPSSSPVSVKRMVARCRRSPHCMLIVFLRLTKSNETLLCMVCGFVI